MSPSKRIQGEAIVVEREDAVTQVILNRPEKLNALSTILLRELGDAISDFASERSARVLVITGAGRAFSAGGDHEFLDLMNPERGYRLLVDCQRWLKTLWNCRKPTIAAVNGPALGAGTSLALACDLVIASEKASFGMAFVHLGLIPDIGGLFALPRAVGLQRAKEMVFTGDKIDVTQASQYGMVTRVVAHEQLMDETLALAKRLAEGPEQAHAFAKAILNRSFESSMEALLDNELLAQSLLFGTEDEKEGLVAFRERRRPHFGQNASCTSADENL